MNTEELEQSLRAEFDGQMNAALSKMRNDVADLQKQYEGEFEKHRAQMDQAFRALSERLKEPVEFDRAFSETVVEHLRLARDEGAEITAMAMGEAEKLKDGNFDVRSLRDAIDEIKSHSTQASILRALVDAAGQFAPRGAFFIVKNDHLVGWKSIGKGELPDENAMRNIHFAIASESLLTDSVRSLTTVEGSYADQNDNAKFLGPLSFGAPNKMYAVPLCARGRGVAVLYADGGEDEGNVNLEALEMLVAVAGLRIELLASATAPLPVEQQAEPVEQIAPEEIAAEPEVQYEPEAEPQYEEVRATLQEYVPAEVEEPQPVEVFEPEVSEPAAFESEVTHSNEVEYVGEVELAQTHTDEAKGFEIEQPSVEEPVAETFDPEPEASTDAGFNFNDYEVESAPVETEKYGEPESVETEPVVEAEAPAEEAPVAEPPIAPPPVKSYRERSLDLPIDVAEDERRPHSDARRFARLLVSEIKLYNEQKVVDGRESGDIYEMLKEAIDRSREMYEKRVQPDVSARFDYFHYELVNNLAEGDEEKLGAGYMAVKA